MIHIKSFVFNLFRVNCFILHNDAREAVLVDPSCQDEQEINEVEDYLANENLVLKAILNTHGHVDHLPGVKYFKEKYNIPFHLHSEDVFLVKEAKEYGAFFGFYIEDPPLPDIYMVDGDYFLLGDEKISYIHVPGHSPGSVVFHLEKDNKLITGDVLFSLSIGRTDLPGGNYQTLVDGINSKLLVLEDDVIVFPGHGPSTTIGEERRMNPFLQ